MIANRDTATPDFFHPQEQLAFIHLQESWFDAIAQLRGSPSFAKRMEGLPRVDPYRLIPPLAPSCTGSLKIYHGLYRHLPAVRTLQEHSAHQVLAATPSSSFVVLREGVELDRDLYDRMTSLGVCLITLHTQALPRPAINFGHYAI